MIIEFIGESGCGKSTLAGRVFPNVPGARRKGSLTTADNLKAMVRVIRDRRARSVFIALAGLSVSVNGLNRMAKNILYYAGLADVLLKAGDRDKVWILDQGLIQAVYSLYFRAAPSDTRYSEIIRRLVTDYPVAVIACSCDDETLRSHITSRMHDPSERGRRIESADAALLRLHADNLKRILSCIPSEQILLIDTTRGLDENVGAVCEFIRTRRTL